MKAFGESTLVSLLSSPSEEMLSTRARYTRLRNTHKHPRMTPQTKLLSERLFVIFIYLRAQDGAVNLLVPPTGMCRIVIVDRVHPDFWGLYRRLRK